MAWELERFCRATTQCSQSFSHQMPAVILTRSCRSMRGARLDLIGSTIALFGLAVAHAGIQLTSNSTWPNIQG